MPKGISPVVSAFVLFSCMLTLTACAERGLASMFFVVVDPSDTARFMDTVEGIARKAELETARAEDVADTGAVMRVLEGRGNGLKLWMQSAPLSGHEDPNPCGVHSEPYPDPAQFVLSTEPRIFGTRSAAKQLGEQLFAEIKRAGFDVRDKSPVCGAAALRHPEVGAQLAPL